jgi:hypothetical protein
MYQGVAGRYAGLTQGLLGAERLWLLALWTRQQKMHPAYGTAMLQALADSKQPVEPTAVFAVIRHIASLGHEAYQDWLGWPLRRYRDFEIPDDIIGIILNRRAHSHRVMATHKHKA